MSYMIKKQGFFWFFFCVFSISAAGVLLSCGRKSTSGGGICGNGILEGKEECDDGNLVDGDGCNHLCQIEEGWECEGAPSVCTEICGDGLIVGDELCDGDDLGGETCESLGLESGDLGCNEECKFDLSECTGEAFCGNGIWEYPEECDGNDLRNSTCESLGFENGVLGCNEDCTFDTSGCNGEEAFCGNGVIDEGEECDGDDLGGETCENLGFDGGVLECDDDCKLDTSGCIDCGDLEYCDGDCVDVRSHMDHCGQCDNPCDSDQVCTGGLCADLDGEWTVVPFPAELDRFFAHDLTSDGEKPYVAVTGIGTLGEHVVVARYDETEWNILGPSPNKDIGGQLQRTVSLALDGNKPYVLFSRNVTAIDQPNLHLMQRTNDGWEQIGAPGYEAPCSPHSHLDLVLEESIPHFVHSAQGCAGGTGYAWYEGEWREHPSTTGHKGLVCTGSTGRAAIVYTDKPYVGVGIATMLMQTTHSMKWWDDQDELWTDLVEPLSHVPGDGYEEHLSAASDEEGNIYVAWSKEAGGSPLLYHIFVKKYDASAGTWSLVGQDHADTSDSANDPSIALIGGYLWLAYTAKSPDALIPRQVFVMRFSESAQKWEGVGDSLNENTTMEGYMPVIAGAGGVPYVAFREDSLMGQQTFYVKRFVAPSITPP